MATTCLACGNSALRRSRAPANDVAYVLRRYLGQRCEEDNAEIDIDQLLSQSWVCRTCAEAYHTHEMKDKRLYAATANSVLQKGVVVQSFHRQTKESVVLL